MKNDTVVFGRACVNHPELSVTVGKTLLGTFRVVFRDTDADAVIESRVFNQYANAHEYAQRLINQN